MTASELLATTRRQQWLQSPWDYSSLPKEVYRHYHFAPIEHCVTLMQQLPLTESGPYARPGGPKAGFTSACSTSGNHNAGTRQSRQ